MYRTIIIASILSIITVFTACGNESNDNSSTTVTNTSNHQSETVPEKNTITITVETQEYKDELLSFIYNEKSYTLPAPKENFVDDETDMLGTKFLSGKIINNKLGE